MSKKTKSPSNMRLVASHKINIGDLPRRVPVDKIYKYISHPHVTRSRRRQVDNDDVISQKLRGMADSDWLAVVILNHMSERYYAKWTNLNTGMRRMAIGNALRQKLLHDEDVIFPDGVVIPGGSPCDPLTPDVD